MSDYREETLEEIANCGEQSLIDYIKFLEEKIERKDKRLNELLSNLENRE